MNTAVSNHIPIEHNFFGYRIINNATGQTAHNVSAAFRYRGYEIAFHTWNPAGHKVSVLLNHVFVGEFGTVEAAIAAVNEHALHEGIWRSNDRDWQQPQSSRSAVRGIHRDRNSNHH